MNLSGLDLYALEKAGFILRRGMFPPSVFEDQHATEAVPPEILSSISAAAQNLFGGHPADFSVMQTAPHTAWQRGVCALTAGQGELLRMEYSLTALIAQEAYRLHLAPGLHHRPLTEDPPTEYVVTHTLERGDLVLCAGTLPFRSESGALLKIIAVVRAVRLSP
jgi:hypothetical protein